MFFLNVPEVYSYRLCRKMMSCLRLKRGQDCIVMGALKNDGHENDGPSKLQGMKLQDMKLTDQLAGHENAGHEIAGHEIARHDKN